LKTAFTVTIGENPLNENGNEKTASGPEYPVILVHGAGVRDDGFFNYWGRIPAFLEKNGARIFYSNQNAWDSVENNAAALKKRVSEVLSETGASRVNLIAHSKGGLEARYMITGLGMHRFVASLTTISTPHYGVKTMEITHKMPSFLYRIISAIVDFFFILGGDKKPDFFTGSRQLSRSYCMAFNDKYGDCPGIYYQSYAAKMRNSFSDLMFFFTHIIIKLIEGENDGLCPVYSAKWGDFKGVITGKKLRGVSHSDVVDMWRMNLSGFDIREIYLKIIRDLESEGC
jgi:triacylglycerol lipase